ncbi:MAG: hypothetical protein SFU83_23665 [Meiothermus sp.]|nr:hypothetical protein [Meiothermus sp.]
MARSISNRLLWFLVLVLAVGMALAQAAHDAGGGVDLCLVYGPVITVVVSLLKRIPWVAQYPKLVAALLSVAAVLAGSYLNLGDASQIVQCVINTFALSVATYEVALKPASKAL